MWNVLCRWLLNPFPKEDPIGDLLIVSSSALDISRIQTGVDLGYANSVPVTVSVVAQERGNADQKIFWAPGSRRDEAHEHYAVCLRCQVIGPADSLALRVRCSG
jgi:hypothetical protein